MNNFISTFAYKLIYVFRINDDTHKGLLKIGEATCITDKSFDELLPNCKELNLSAKNRINQYTTTAGITYDLLYTEIAVHGIKFYDNTSSAKINVKVSKIFFIVYIPPYAAKNERIRPPAITEAI